MYEETWKARGELSKMPLNYTTSLSCLYVASPADTRAHTTQTQPGGSSELQPKWPLGVCRFYKWWFEAKALFLYVRNISTEMSPHSTESQPVRFTDRLVYQFLLIKDRGPRGHKSLLPAALLCMGRYKPGFTDLLGNVSLIKFSN